MVFQYHDGRQGPGMLISTVTVQGRRKPQSACPVQAYNQTDKPCWCDGFPGGQPPPPKKNQIITFYYALWCFGPATPTARLCNFVHLGPGIHAQVAKWILGINIDITCEAMVGAECVTWLESLEQFNGKAFFRADTCLSNE